MTLIRMTVQGYVDIELAYANRHSVKIIYRKFRDIYVEYSCSSEDTIKLIIPR